jgi:hypothetical protein
MLGRVFDLGEAILLKPVFGFARANAVTIAFFRLFQQETMELMLRNIPVQSQ